ncbi:hypothetical protein MLD38_001267 [Melastoma candidum]|uniref:Uncharacterized protein n=1 Tax=Melastoma candidum TaxID=119954 RepID=A0ACB9SEN6_9MYRT|nr:hypothetical protein MLD38_001267 [Melastoma candidum]
MEQWRASCWIVDRSDACVEKLSLEDRVAFTENHLDDILDSADRPLEGKRWWLNAERSIPSAWQFASISQKL